MRPRTPSYGREEAEGEEMERAEGGREGGSDGEGEKLNERDRAKLREATTTKLLQQSSKWNYRPPSLPFSPHAWLLSSRK